MADKRRVVARKGALEPEDIGAWCEECRIEFNAPGRYGMSRAARRHTRATGHTTTADRSGRSVWFEAQ